jgi:hypothetical protein
MQICLFVYGYLKKLSVRQIFQLWDRIKKHVDFIDRIIIIVVLGGIGVIVLAIGPKVRVFKLVRERWIFKGDLIP